MARLSFIAFSYAAFNDATEVAAFQILSGERGRPSQDRNGAGAHYRYPSDHEVLTKCS